MGSAAAGTHMWPGATALAALLQGAWLAVASVGDCRAVRTACVFAGTVFSQVLKHPTCCNPACGHQDSQCHSRAMLSSNCSPKSLQKNGAATEPSTEPGSLRQHNVHQQSCVS